MVEMDIQNLLKEYYPKNLKIVIHREQGYGDDFMASRFLKSFLGNRL